MNPPTGSDLPSTLVERIADLMAGKYAPENSQEETQLRELAFWRWVAYEGYAGKPPLSFIEHQRNFMTGCYLRTGWPLDKFINQSTFELGCGPLGMIEFIPSVKRTAYDPLNEHYSELFLKLRVEKINYLTIISEIESLALVDFGICFNVLDHTDDARHWFELFISKIKPGGHFLLQVNTTKDGFPQTVEHQKMHPSPLTHEEIMSMISSKSDRFDQIYDSSPSADNEFFFMAWGTKRL